MTDNVIKSSDVNKKSEGAKKAPAKKAAAKKADIVVKSDNEHQIIVFESGSSFSSGDIRFTSQNRVQEVSKADAERLLQLENFRLPDQFEIEEYLKNKED